MDICDAKKIIEKKVKPKKLLYHFEPIHSHIIIDYNNNIYTTYWDDGLQLKKLEGHKYYNGEQKTLMGKCKSAILEKDIKFDKTNLIKDCRNYLIN